MSVNTFRSKSLYLTLLFYVISALPSCFIFNFSSGNHNSVKSTKVPFTLHINDEVNDGERLHILGSITAATEWKLKDVLVKLTSISNGKTVGLSYLPLTQSSNQLVQSIKPNENYSFTISVPSKQITDYQLELLWGEEAKSYLVSMRNQGSGVLEIRNIQVETIRQPCEGIDCKVTFRAKASLYNATNKTINKVILGIGFTRLPLNSPPDLSAQVPQHEDKIDVGEIKLLPQNSRDIVINFDQEIPESELQNESGEVKPAIRILNFSTE